MAAKKPARVEVRSRVSDHKVNLQKDKYDAMKAALLRILPKRPPGLTQAEMVKGVLPHLPETIFPGGATAMWWVKTVQLDLEARKVVLREGTKPLRWYRA